MRKALPSVKTFKSICSVSKTIFLLFKSSLDSPNINVSLFLQFRCDQLLPSLYTLGFYLCLLWSSDWLDPSLPGTLLCSNHKSSVLGSLLAQANQGWCNPGLVYSTPLVVLGLAHVTCSKYDGVAARWGSAEAWSEWMANCPSMSIVPWHQQTFIQQEKVLAKSQCSRCLEMSFQPFIFAPQ